MSKPSDPKPLAEVLDELATTLRTRHGARGFTVFYQSPSDVIVLGIDNAGRPIGGVANWHPQPTAEAAIRDLHRQLTAGPTEGEIRDIAEVLEEAGKL